MKKIKSGATLVFIDLSPYLVDLCIVGPAQFNVALRVAETRFVGRVTSPMNSAEQKSPAGVVTTLRVTLTRVPTDELIDGTGSDNRDLV